MYFIPTPKDILNYYYNQTYNAVTDVVNWKNAETLKEAALARPDISFPVLAIGAAVSLYAISKCFSSNPTTEKSDESVQTTSESQITSYSATMTVESEEIKTEQSSSSEGMAIVTAASAKQEDEVIDVNATELAQKQSEKTKERKWTVYYYIGNQPILMIDEKIFERQMEQLERVCQLWFATPHFCPNCLGFQNPVFAFPPVPYLLLS